MKLTKSYPVAWLAGVLSLVLFVFAAACNQGTIALIEAGISAGEIVAEAAGVLPPGVATYINQAEQAFGDITTETAAPDTTIQKAIDIHTELASLVLPDLTGLSAANQQKVQKIDSVITQLLAAYPAAASSARFVARDAKVNKPALSAKDAAKLAALSARAKAVQAKLNDIRFTTGMESTRPGPVAAIICSGKAFDSCLEATTDTVYGNDLVYRYMHNQLKFQIAKLRF